MKLKSTHDGPHRYERMKVGRNDHEIYKCMLAGCPHYLPSLELAIGRISLCHGLDCTNTVELTKDLVGRKIVKPMCDSCKEERKKRLLALQSVPFVSGNSTEELENYEGEEYEE